MNSDKSIEIESDPEILAAIVTAMHFYVESHFPRGSADCGQVAREELLNIVKALESSLANGTTARYSRRMRAMVKEGIRVHCEYLAQQDGGSHARECALLQAASRGEAHTRHDLLFARAEDRRSANPP